MDFLPHSLSTPFLEMTDADFVRRAASSPQLVRVRARSNSASSSASLTATEDNYSRLRERSSASTSQFPLIFPPAWSFAPAHSSVPAEQGTRRSLEPEDASESEEEPVENDDVLFMSRPSSSTNVTTGMRSRRTPARRKEPELPRMVTTARGQPCAGETETELDELVRMLDYFILIIGLAS